MEARRRAGIVVRLTGVFRWGRVGWGESTYRGGGGWDKPRGWAVAVPDLPVNFEVEGVGTELDLVVPCDRTMWCNVDPLEDSTVVPGLEYSPAREIRQVDFASGPVGESEPDSQPLTRLDLQHSNHALPPSTLAVDRSHSTARMIL